MTNFCAIAPTAFLGEFCEGRPYHLLLAHLVETDPNYRNWYVEHKKRHPESYYIMDNAGFERYRANVPMFESDKLVDLGKACSADVIVLSDYPNQPGQKTIDKALEMAPVVLNADFGTFFCPQSREGDLQDLLNTFMWAVSDAASFIDIVGHSIIGIPNAYGVDRGNKLQRYVARNAFCYELEKLGYFEKNRKNYQSNHMLGCVDGWKEYQLLAPFIHWFDTADSSSPIHHGFKGIQYDSSPSGLLNGKEESEYDFNRTEATTEQLALAHQNLAKIDQLLEML